MKKTLRILALALVLITVLGVLASCGVRLIGKWKDESGITYQFKAGGKGVMSYGSMSQEFKWKVSGNKLKMTIVGEANTFKFKISGRKLKIYEDGELVQTLTKK